MSFIKRIAIIGSIDTVLPFKSIGLNDFPVSSSKEAEDILKKIIREDYGIIYIEESFAKEFLNVIYELNKEDQNIVLSIIPGAKGGGNFSLQKLRLSIKRAIGMDILNED